MRILQINSTVNWGSTGKIADGIGLEIQKRNWESYIAYGRTGNQSKSNLIKIGNKKDVYLHILKSRIFDGHGLGSKNATIELIEEIERINPDLIHLHNIHGYYLNYSVLFDFFNNNKVPVVWTLHDCWSFTGHCAYFDTVNCTKWESHCKNCVQIKSYPRSLVDNSRRNYELKLFYFSSIKDRLNLVPVSKWLSDLLEKSFFKDFKRTLIYNGVDLNLFQPSYDVNLFQQDYMRSKRKLILGIASVWDKRKGLDDFIQLSSIISSDYEIVLIGLSSKQIKRLPPNIRGIERTQNVNELVELYRQALVLVNPTWEDNFPTVNLEALACGTPVITYRTGGSPEAIDENTGIIVEKGDVQGLKNAIETIAISTDKYTVEQCRQRAERFFGREDRFREYISLYEELLKK